MDQIYFEIIRNIPAIQNFNEENSKSTLMNSLSNKVYLL